MKVECKVNGLRNPADDIVIEHNTHTPELPGNQEQRRKKAHWVAELFDCKKQMSSKRRRGPFAACIGALKYTLCGYSTDNF